MLFEPTTIFSILVALSVHEWAHAFVATRLGDPTARNAGRLTLNPIAHIDPLGAILFLVVGFGWAKPVPVNGAYFRNERRDTALVALAGPLSNLVLAALAFAGLMIVGKAVPGSAMTSMMMMSDGSVASPLVTVAIQVFASSLFVNLALMAFNLIPIVPLDGSRILLSLLPGRLVPQFQDLMRYGPAILLTLLLAEALLGFPILSLWVYTVVDVAIAAFYALT